MDERAFHHGAHNTFTRKVILTFTAVCGLIGAFLLLDTPAGAVAFIGAMASGITISLLSKRLHKDIVAHLTGAMLWSLLVTLGALNGGGLGAPGLIALPLIPVLAFFIGGQRVGIIWLGITLLAPVVLYLADPLLPPARLGDAAITRLHGLSTMVAIIVLGIFAWQYDRDVVANVESLRKARLLADQANEAKSVFLATMSHEIRTPLAGILAAAELLKDAPEGPDRDALVKLLRQSGQGLHALVDQILDLSRLEAGAVALEAIPVRLDTLLTDAISVHRPAATQAGVELTAEVAQAHEPWVLADPVRVRQIVQNLVSNAIKFTDGGQVTVRLSRVDKAWTIEVEDTGIGIDPDVLPNLFQPFRQADEGTARAFGGSGLGLAIVHDLVSRMDGSITVRTRRGAGSCFIVRLPLPKAHVTPRPTPSNTDVPLDLHVLLTDDNAVNRAVMARMLGRLGCSVVVADSGTAAIDAARDEAFDLILMDVHMPGIDGLEATRQIVAERQVPVVALTASQTAEVEQACAAAGMVGFVPKPVSLDRLRTVLASRR